MNPKILPWLVVDAMVVDTILLRESTQKPSKKSRYLILGLKNGRNILTGQQMG
jgi:hypothetical protein